MAQPSPVNDFIATMMQGMQMQTAQREIAVREKNAMTERVNMAVNIASQMTDPAQRRAFGEMAVANVGLPPEFVEVLANLGPSLQAQVASRTAAGTEEGASGLDYATAVTQLTGMAPAQLAVSMAGHALGPEDQTLMARIGGGLELSRPQEAQLAQQESQFGRSLAQDESQFGRRMGQDESQFRRNLGENVRQFNAGFAQRGAEFQTSVQLQSGTYLMSQDAELSRVQRGLEEQLASGTLEPEVARRTATQLGDVRRAREGLSELRQAGTGGIQDLTKRRHELEEQGRKLANDLGTVKNPAARRELTAAMDRNAVMLRQITDIEIGQLMQSAEKSADPAEKAALMDAAAALQAMQPRTDIQPRELAPFLGPLSDLWSNINPWGR